MAIRVGIGGWTFPPWRGPFYPKGLVHSRELAYAAGHLTAIEVNGTFYRTQTEATFRKWAAETPDGFVFTVKGPRYVTHRGTLAEAGPSIARFFASGVAALGDKLGPVLWQFLPSKRFDPGDCEAFLAQLPEEVGGRRIRHALEVRHDSFLVPAFADLARQFGAAIVYADSDEHPAMADPTADFVYARLQRSSEEEALGYDEAGLDAWAGRARTWAAGGIPDDLPVVATAKAPAKTRDVFLFFISGAKVRNPAAAQALIARLA